MFYLKQKWAISELGFEERILKLYVNICF